MDQGWIISIGCLLGIDTNIIVTITRFWMKRGLKTVTLIAKENTAYKQVNITTTELVWETEKWGKSKRRNERKKGWPILES
jgi:chaperone required for assembly of F1-ATPase